MACMPKGVIVGSAATGTVGMKGVEAAPGAGPGNERSQACSCRNAPRPDASDGTPPIRTTARCQTGRDDGRRPGRHHPSAGANFFVTIIHMVRGVFMRATSHHKLAIDLEGRCSSRTEVTCSDQNAAPRHRIFDKVAKQNRPILASVRSLRCDCMASVHRTCKRTGGWSAAATSREW